MATTTNYGWETPDDSDLLKDGAAAIRTLGSSIDTTTKALNPSTTLGDIEYRSSTANTNTRLAIGSTGQTLTVVSGAPAWAASATSVLTTTGDLLYASAANTLARRAVGNTNEVLTVSGGLPTWSAITAAPQISIQIAGEYLGTPNIFSSVRTAVEDVTYFVPIYLPGINFDRIACRTASTFSGTATVRLGIYNASLTSGKPTTVYLDAGTVSCTAASTIYTITINSTPPAGIYYLAFNMQTAATTSTFQGPSTSSPANYILQQNYGTTPDASLTPYYPNQTGVTGAFGTASVSAYSNTAPHTYLRMA